MRQARRHQIALHARDPVGLATAKRFPWKDLPAYVIVQCAGAIGAVAVLWAIQTSKPGGFEIAQGSFASNAYGQENGRAFYDLPGAAISEAVLTALAVREGRVPPTINVEDLDEACGGVDHVLGASREAPVRLALSNSFGFGGHNAVLAFAAMEEA